MSEFILISATLQNRTYTAVSNFYNTLLQTLSQVSNINNAAHDDDDDDDDNNNNNKK